MPTSHEIHEEAGVVILEARGKVNDAEIVEALDRLGKDPRMKRGYALLVDVRNQALGTVSSDGVRVLSKIRSPVARESRKAVLLSTEFGYGMARMFNLNVGEDERSFAIFRDEGEARRYVGLDPE